MSPRLSRIALYTVVLLGAFLSLTQLQLDYFTDDPGVGWHLETGRYISESSTIPRTDPFLSMTRPWISDQWLSDLILYEIYSSSGWPILYAAGIILYLGTFFLVLFKLHRHLGYATSSSLIALLLCSKLGVIHFIFRPVLFSFLLFSLLFALCARSARVTTKSLSNRWLLLTPLILILWTNLHPSFPLGVLLLSMLLVDFVAAKFIFGSERSSSSTHRLLFGISLSCICTLINPYGFDLHQSIFTLSGNEFFMNLHQEWKPLLMSSAEGELFLMIGGIIITGLFVYGREKLGLSFFEFMSVGIFAAASLFSVRYVPYFAIVASSSLAAVLHAVRFSIFSTLRENFPATQNSRTRGEGVVFLLSALVLIGFTLITHRVPTYSGRFGPSEDRYPFGAMKYLTQLNQKLIVYNHPNWGGFLTRYGSGIVRPVLDDRNTLLGEDPYRKFLASQKSKELMVAEARSYGSHYALLRNEDMQKMCSAFQDQEIAYQDTLSTIIKISPEP